MRAPDANAAFWAMEDALKSGALAAVIGEIWHLEVYGLAASRRLLLAARKGGRRRCWCWPSAYGHAERLSTAAETRFEIAAAPSARVRRRAAATCPAPSPARRGW